MSMVMGLSWNDLTGQHSIDIRSTYSMTAAGRKSGRRIKDGHSMAMERWRPLGLSTRDGGEPFRVSDIQTEVNRLFENVLGRPASLPGHVWVPPVDMYATKDDLILTLELPGVSEKDVTVTITGDLLTVKGERRFEQQAKQQDLLHVVRTYGKFERLVQLPMGVAGDRAKATYRDAGLE